jgi:two-component system nitrogen regulation sensor histidine kinase NtrY
VDVKEQRRRRRERILILVTFFVIVALTYIESRLSSVESLIPFSHNVLIFGLININIILILLLIFLIVRNVVKLVYERRHGILGSKLRTKLVAAFVSLSLIPTVALFLVSVNFLSYSIDHWFDIKVGGALNMSLEVAQAYYQQFTESSKYYAKQLSSIITENQLYEKERNIYLKALIEQRQKSLNLSLIEVYFKTPGNNLIVRGTENVDIVPIKPSTKIMDDVFTGKEVSTIESVNEGDVISGLSPIYNKRDPKDVIGLVGVYYYIPNGLVNRMDYIAKTSEEYKQFRILKNPIKLSYIITLSIVTLLIVFSATWFGLFLAKGITVPIQDLAEATHKIAQRNLDHQIDIKADDEIGVLVDSFNQMTRTLKQSSEDLEQANVALDQRRKYMETVLRNVWAGVVSIDRDGVITTINRAAEKMLDIKTEKVLNRRYQDVLRPEHMELVSAFLKEMKENKSDFIEKQIQITLKDRALTVLAATNTLEDDEGNYMGLVVVFEDLTQLQKAERLAAWREVARRIAHEIKNPLTPIQLSAQRLQRKYGDKLGDDGAVLQECTKTIIDQVDGLKNLVNEFSRFARMPMTTPTASDLNEVVTGAVSLFKDAHKDIAISLQPDPEIPVLNLDAEQIKRVMINLMDNAVAAVPQGDGKIEIRTSYDRINRRVRVEVMDNGSGISPADKMRMFEPYFSTKKSGTGLGLAIVSSIISDHAGQVSVRDNTPRGTIVSFELPVG